jgi:hypothetical protein
MYIMSVSLAVKYHFAALLIGNGLILDKYIKNGYSKSNRMLIEDLYMSATDVSYIHHIHSIGNLNA